MKYLLLFLCLTATASAHVGSPDVFYEGNAGPYQLLVTVRPPAMIPGVAEVEIRAISDNVTGIHIVPVYITLQDQGYPPTPDVMQAVPGDPHTFTGKVWLMASGSWEVRAEIDGRQGSAKLAVPVPAFARRTLPMQKTLGILLFGLMLFLVAGVVAIAGAAAREGSLVPGATPEPRSIRRGRMAMLLATVTVLGILFLGNWWWNSEASTQKYDMLYKAPPLAATLENGDHLLVKMGASHWHDRRKASWSMQLVPDHGHLMHLFLLRVPAMDRFYHLHPEQTPDGSFAVELPSMDAGHYKLFADIVRETGFPDTMVTEMDLPQIAGRTLAGDDSGGSAAAFGAGSDRVSQLADGGRMVWQPDTAAPAIGKLSWFRFRVEDNDGKPVSDLEPYMGMAGHAVFVRSDESVFAHIHPAGSAPMAALTIAQKESGAAMDMSRHSMALPSEISFPYGFPQPGDYRLFVQVKRNGRVETGVFDTKVAN